MASAIGCFQPGTFLWGHAHAEGLSKVTADGKYLPSTPDLGVGRDRHKCRLPMDIAVLIALDAMLRMACSPKAGNVIETYKLKAHFVERKPFRGRQLYSRHSLAAGL